MNLERIYEIAIQTRNFEIELFWKRTGYFMALNTAIAIGYLTQAHGPLTFLFTVFGSIVCVIWYFVSLGSKFWQSRWEERTRQIEIQLEKEDRPKIGLFHATWEEIENDVRRSLENNRHNQLRRFFSWQVMKKPSVSFQMSLLALIFLFSWLVAFSLEFLIAQQIAQADAG